MNLVELDHALRKLRLSGMAATLEAQGEQIAERAPMRRIGSEVDMAGVSIYLASRAASYVTGAVIPVDGGLSTCLATWGP